MMEEYVDDASRILGRSLRSMKRSTVFRKVFRTSLAADAVLSKLAQRRLRPPLKGARSIILRMPLLVAARQCSVAYVEMRRLVELALWTVYFTDHRVEWATFKASPETGLSRDVENPIGFCAFREAAFYLNYAKQRMTAEPSGLGKEAVASIRQNQARLNRATHPGDVARAQARVPPFGSSSPQTLEAFAKLQRCVFADICMVMAAFLRKRFDVLPAMHRAHFDWLIGSRRSKQVRSGPFGLA
jgi:hypothetical protein